MTMKRFLQLLPGALALLLWASCAPSGDKTLRINDLEYFEARGVNVLVYSNAFDGGFNDEKNSGIEIIQHGVRTAQGGAVRLNKTPEQWDLVPKTTSRNVDRENGVIEVGLNFPDYNFDSRITVTGQGDAVEIAVWLDNPVPEELAGEAGLNLEFLPSQYWLKTFWMDGRVNRLPRYAASNTLSRPNAEKPRQFKGYKTYDDRGTDQFVDPLPLESGHELILAPDDPERTVRIASEDALIEIFDGRIVAQNGWFVVRSVLPAGKTGKVLSWTVAPQGIPGWIREPNIGFSQVGYVPSQPKVAVIELDRNDKVRRTAEVWRIGQDGAETRVFSGPTTVWGQYFKYNYVKFDFSEVRDPGVYFLRYGKNRTGNFIIDESVLDHITDATSDVWIPIHMNHVTVNEAYRIWHGEPFREGYLQAPPNTDHFDMHGQGPSTYTKYKALELIPGLNVGGYFDAGDFDIETGANIGMVQSLIDLWNEFHPDRDETFVSEAQRYVDLHRPDGKPDILQYMAHGVLNIVAQAENIGHMSQCLSNSVLDNYHHLGDAASITDGLHYDPRLKPYEISKDGKSSGTPDDMWAFTGQNPGSDLRAANVLAAAADILDGYDDALAARARKSSEKLSREATALMAARGGSGRGMMMMPAAPADETPQARRERILATAMANPARGIGAALDEIPNQDASFKEALRPAIEWYKEHYLDSLDTVNPYGVPIGLGNWAGSGNVVSYGTTAVRLSREFPDIIGPEYALKAAGFLFGCHPYHNYSLVAAVGAARPKEVFYGNNRADLSFIPGNLAPGLLFRKPDHFENYDDWPFLWGENEGTIAGNTAYLHFGLALQHLMRGE